MLCKYTSLCVPDALFVQCALVPAALRPGLTHLSLLLQPTTIQRRRRCMSGTFTFHVPAVGCIRREPASCGGKPLHDTEDVVPAYTPDACLFRSYASGWTPTCTWIGCERKRATCPLILLPKSAQSVHAIRHCVSASRAVRSRGRALAHGDTLMPRTRTRYSAQEEEEDHPRRRLPGSNSARAMAIEIHAQTSSRAGRHARKRMQ